MNVNPLYSLIRATAYLLAGRLKFPRDRIGKVFQAEDGRVFTIFRQIVVRPGARQPEKPGALFRVRFRVSNMTPTQNKRFSLLPIPFFIGLPGFRSKLWMAGEITSDLQGADYQGIYEWDTVQDAERYAHSFAMKFMMMRSMPGSVSWEVAPQ